MVENMTLASNSEFKSWVSQLKKDIRSAQIKTAIKVNTELLRLYWRMGADICEKQKSASWGDGWLKELSRELMAEFPDMKGLSYRNLQYIRQWYLFYSQGNIIVQQVVAQLQEGHWQQPVAKLGEDNGQQLVAQISEDIFFSVPWGHHLYIISQCKDVDRAVFYLQKTVENGWSRAVLLNYLDTNLYERQGKAVNNFNRLLADPQSELAAQTLKDPYNFDFLTLDGEYRERELEQLGVYVSAVNHIKKKPTDNPTIGLLICKTKNNVMAQYALESTNQPIGISEYQLSKLMPENIQSQLPTIEDIEATLSDIKETKDFKKG